MEILTAWDIGPVQAIVDLHLGNVFYVERTAGAPVILKNIGGEQVSGFIDCDHLSLGPRVFDLADFIVHMIKQDVTDPERTAAWFGLFPAVIQGYEMETPLLKEEKEALYYVMFGVLLMLAGCFFQTGDAAKARSELEAIDWMYHHRQEILDRIISPDSLKIC
ncbi:MAG: hypothetical protein WHX52_03055 [Anaerolineae bacterium]